MPELPRVKRERFIQDHGIAPATARGAHRPPWHRVSFSRRPRPSRQWVKVANFVQSEVLRDVEMHGLDVKVPVSPDKWPSS